VVFANDIVGDVFQGGGGNDTLSFDDLRGLGFTAVTAAKMLLNDTNSIEYVSSNGLVLKGTTAANTFNFSGVIGFSTGVGIDTVSISLMDGADKYIAPDTALKVDAGAGNDSLTGGAASDTLDGVAGAVDAADRILYDPTTGRISCDSDGSGGVARVLFAQVTVGLTLAASDFVVI
jgi:Ca2+-binding RTX toxin-like protein